MVPVIETDIVLRDGSTVHVRPTTAEDVPRLRAFLASLSDRSRWFRFFSAGVDLDDAARRAADPGDGLSLLALRGAEGTVVGHGTYIRAGPGRAEVAFAVADAWHGHGIATVLLAHLAHAAAGEGIETFSATVLSENRRMLGVFHDSGFPVVARRSEGEIELELPTSLSRAARRALRGAPAHRRRRGRRARPAPGLGRGDRRVGGRASRRGRRNLRAGGFAGTLHVVPTARARRATSSSR